MKRAVPHYSFSKVSTAERLATCAACLLLLAQLVACGSGGEQSRPALDKVRAVVLPILFTAPFHIAAAEGFFENAGLDVEAVRLTRNIDAIPALAQGQVDVGAGQLTVAMINAIGNGAAIRVVAGSGHLAPDGCSFNAIVVRRELLRNGEITDPEQLRGRRLEVDVTLPQAYWLEAGLGSLGLTFDDMEIVNVPAAATVDAFLNGAYDLTAVTEPRVTQMVQTGVGEVWRGSEEIVPDYPQNLVFFGGTLREERPEVGERFMTALVRGIRQYNLGKTDRNLEIMEEAVGLSRDELTATCWASIFADGHVPAAGLGGYQEWARERGLIDRILSEDEIIDRRFIDAANAALAR